MRSVRTFFLVVGSDEAYALHDVLAEKADPYTHPAAGIRRTPGEATWWVDRDAAAYWA